MARFYDVHFLSLGSGSDAQAFEPAFGKSVPRYAFAEREGGTVRRHLRKIGRTLTGRCDFLPARERNLRRMCAEASLTNRFDAILLSSVLLRALPVPPGVPLIGDTHNVEFDVLRRTAVSADRFLIRQYAKCQWRSMRREERRCARKVDLLLATSERDRALFERELGLSHVAVVPNGIDLDEFAPSSVQGSDGTILFSGLMSYYPNQQAIRWFLSEVYPAVRREVREARLVVAGSSPPAWLTGAAGSHLEVTGWVPDIRPYLQRAAVVVAPLLIGGGTRVKILEALAMRKPVVSTPLGAEGLNLVDGECAFLADDAGTFARRVIEVLRHHDVASRLGTNGREHVSRSFDWNRIGSEMSARLDARFGLASRVATRPPPRSSAPVPTVTLQPAV